MKSLLIKQASCIEGELNLLGDKSIAHRSIIISSLAKGRTTLKNFPFSKDCLFTISVFKKLGIKIKQEHLKVGGGLSKITVFGKGLYGLKEPNRPIFIGDSGTTLRLILGVLSGQDFAVRLISGHTLSYRPMLRVTQPLRMMGAEISAKRKAQNEKLEEYPPITIRGGSLKPITYKMQVASAQVKSAILLAGLYTPGATAVIEPVKTRDHTERILKLFKAQIKVEQNTIVIKGNKELVSPGKIYIPGDISSASFFIVLASILPNSKILIRNVSLNPRRTGIIRVLRRMGADIRVTGYGLGVTGSEPMADVVVKSSRLKGTIVKREEIPALIDELPVLMVAASVASGKTVFKGVSELRLKETDRIKSIFENLTKMGAELKVLIKGRLEHIVISGVENLKCARLKSFGDHRTAMSMVVAGLRASGESRIDDITCINKSFPNFISILKKIIR